MLGHTDIQALMQKQLTRFYALEDCYQQLMFVMKKRVLSRPLSFLASLLRFTTHVKNAFDFLSIVEASLPELAQKSKSIDVTALNRFVQTVEKYFDL